MGTSDDDRVVRRTLERELRKSVHYNPSDPLLAAWSVDILSLEINDVEVSERERPKGWAGALRKAAKMNAGSALAFTEKQMLLRTSQSLYAPPAGLLYVIRSAEKVVQLLWVDEAPAPGSAAAALVPEAVMPLKGRLMFVAQLDAFSTSRAEVIVRRLVERRSAFITLLDEEAQAATHRMIQQCEGLPFL